MKFPIFDLHCDSAFKLLGADFSATDNLYRNKNHIDLCRAKQLPGYAQCFACFTTPWDDLPGKLTVEDVFERELSVILRELNANTDIIRQAYSAADVEENRKAGIMSAILTIEGPAGFGYDPSLLENLHQIGFRVTTLGWNEKNILTGSHKTGGGLTDLGREYVKEAQRLGMLIDVSHISDEAFWDIMQITNAPVIATHSNSRAICDVTRNLTDDMFRAICQTGGVVGLNLYSEFLGQSSDMDTACNHVLHFLELDPSGRHIALGGDLDGCDTLPKDFNGIQDYPVLADRLLLRGASEQNIKNIFWNNALGVIDSAVCNNKK